MSDAQVSVHFSASTSGLDAGIASTRDALASLAAPIADVNAKYSTLGNTLSEAHSRALQAMRSGDTAAYADSMRAAQQALDYQIGLERERVNDILAASANNVRNRRIASEEELQDAREMVERSYALELELMNRKRALVEGSLAQRARLDSQILQLDMQRQQALEALTEDSLAAQYAAYARFGERVAGAFHTQLHGLITGTLSWRDAFRNMLTRLLIDVIEFGEKTVVHWIAAEAAKTAASATGTAARTGLAQAGAAVSLAAQGAAMIRSILGSAAEAFAGVFGFLSPMMGPFAAGPAAAAQATVASMAGAVASADIGMWSVPADMLTLVHHNELIMPASEASAFRELLTGSRGGEAGGSSVAITPTTHFHVNAIDGASVSQWMRANSGQLLRAVDEAVRHGAHLGLRRLASF